MGSVSGCMMSVLSEIQLETRALLFEPSTAVVYPETSSSALWGEGKAQQYGRAILRRRPCVMITQCCSTCLVSQGGCGVGWEVVLTQKATYSLSRGSRKVMIKSLCYPPPLRGLGLRRLPRFGNSFVGFRKKEKSSTSALSGTTGSPPARRSIGVEQPSFPGPILSAKASSVPRFS